MTVGYYTPLQRINIAKFLIESWKHVDFNWHQLTPQEQALCPEGEWKSLAVAAFSLLVISEHEWIVDNLTMDQYGVMHEMKKDIE